jgi:hypothetical protein
MMRSTGALDNQRARDFRAGNATMTRSNPWKSGSDDASDTPTSGDGTRRRFPSFSFGPPVALFVLAALIVYAGYFWFVRRVVVDANKVLVVMKKFGTESLPGDQVIIPRAPDQKTDPSGYSEWENR